MVCNVEISSKGERSSVGGLGVVKKLACLAVEISLAGKELRRMELEKVAPCSFVVNGEDNNRVRGRRRWTTNGEKTDEMPPTEIGEMFSRRRRWLPWPEERGEGLAWTEP